MNRCRSWKVFHGFKLFFVRFVQIFSEWSLLQLRRSTTVGIRCGSWNFYGFQRFLGFHSFWTKLFELPWIYIDLNSLVFLSKKRVSLCVYLCFNRRFEPESSRTLGFWFCFVDFWLESENKSVISSFHLHRFKSFESSFSFLLNFSLCDRAWVFHYQWWIRAWIVAGTVQWWRFNVESLRTTMNFIEFAWILILEKLGFMHCSLFSWISGFLWILIVTE